MSRFPGPRNDPASAIGGMPVDPTAMGRGQGRPTPAPAPAPPPPTEGDTDDPADPPVDDGVPDDTGIDIGPSPDQTPAGTSGQGRRRGRKPGPGLGSIRGVRITVNLERGDWATDALPAFIRSRLTDQIGRMKATQLLPDGGEELEPEPDPEPDPVRGELHLVIEVDQEIPPIATGNATVRQAESLAPDPVPDEDMDRDQAPILAYLTDDVDTWELDLGNAADQNLLLREPDRKAWGYDDGVGGEGYFASVQDDVTDTDPDPDPILESATLEATADGHRTRQAALIEATWRLVTLRVVQALVDTGQIDESVAA